MFLRMRLLLVEDDAAMAKALSRSLERRGFVINACADGVAALAALQSRQDDVAVLDLTLPGLDGLHVLQAARAAGIKTPVLILTARGTVGDRVAGLNAGADDYLAKPFDLDELEARVRALLRRAGVNEPAQSLGRLRFERSSGAFYLDKDALELTPREHALLKALFARPGQALPKERLLASVFAQESDVLPDAIEVVVYRLRKKLEGAGVQLVTLRGLGYLLKEQT